MRNADERVRAVLRRAEELRTRESRRETWLAMGSVTACLALIVGLAFVMPDWAARTTAAPKMDSSIVTASLFSDSGMLGYLVIGILSFFLGATVTILCFRLRRRSGSGDEAR